MFGKQTNCVRPGEQTNVVREQERILIKSINRSQAIVNSLFPEIVRDRIMEEGHWAAAKSTRFTNISKRPSFSSKNLIPEVNTLIDAMVLLQLP